MTTHGADNVNPFDTNAGRYSLTKIKTFQGRDGQGFNATVCLDGKPIAFAMDEGCGGEMSIDFRNPGQTAKSFEQHKATAKIVEGECIRFFADWWKTAPQMADARATKEALAAKYPESHLVDELDPLVDWINWAIDTQATRKRFDRRARKETVFRLKTDAPGKYRTLNVPVTDPRALKYLRETFGTALEYVHGAEVDAVAG